MKKKILHISILILICVIFLLFILNPINQINSRNKEIIIQDNDNNELMRIVNNHKISSINIEDIPQINIDILLAIEDKEFYNHHGFNLTRIFKTIISNIKNKRVYGASTLTQQYIKNVYLSNEKKLSRKITEIYYAIKLEQLLTKEQILTKYLNCLYFGNDIYGLCNASKYYFNKHYSNLTIQEFTTLIAIINAPTYYTNHLDKLNNRKNVLLKYLYDNNIISVTDYYISKKPITFKINKQIYNGNLLHYIDGVLNEFNTLSIKSNFNEEITIKTKYNIKTNNINITSNANYAGIAVDKEGYIISLIGNNDYYKSTFNIVTKGNRDIGSTIKPLLYYEAIKCGFENQHYYSSPYSFKYNDEIITIKNYGSSYPNKYISMKEAIATSDNIYAIKTHQALGFKTLANHLIKYNIHAKSLPSLALGSVGMSLWQLTRIYSQFFTEGKYLNFQYITEVLIDNKTCYKSKPLISSLGNSEIFTKIKNLMSAVFDNNIPHSTASSISGNLITKCYGKSGLTDYDSYMIGFSNNILVGAWSGYTDNDKLISIEEKRIPKQLFVELININEKEPNHSD